MPPLHAQYAMVLDIHSWELLGGNFSGLMEGMPSRQVYRCAFKRGKNPMACQNKEGKGVCNCNTYLESGIVRMTGQPT
jgi:hypothetical protein